MNEYIPVIKIMKECIVPSYILFAFIFSYFFGLSWYKRTVDKQEKLSQALLNAVVQLFGFALVAAEVWLLLSIKNANNSATQIIFGIIFFPLFFLTFLCISGRGVGVAQWIQNKGIRSVRISWNGVTIEFRD